MERVELNPDVVPIAEETLFTSTQDLYKEEKLLSYARYFEPDDDGCWQVPGCPSPTAASTTLAPSNW